ncbi:hypothetical protein BJ138DRAFT_1165666 [Hygrophoropsis aurantiaca]|uniref:Uncharacterized protein n=1 Tax=Hygrophoropsis aurantiaca TaxID=72124 RepID=A0ACB7ZV64_9AGAM|nr:hypothetical protein BJ138DRAFT_1165666 [Hygrophoropsis aurantiaca]
MLFSLFNTALLCLIAGTAVHAFKTHNYTVEVTGKGGHKTSYSGTLPEFVECDTCQSLKKASYDPEFVSFETGDFAIKGNPLFELKFYKEPLCTGNHLAYVVGPTPAGAVVLSNVFKPARGISVCRPNLSVVVH